MKHIYKFVAVCGLLLILAACQSKTIEGNGNISAALYNVPYFTKVKLSGAYKSVILIGAAQKVSIHADSNILPYIKARVDDHTLYIYMQNGYSINPSITPEINIGVAMLEQISTSGSARVTVSGISAKKFVAKISGSGHFNLGGISGKADLEISGSGNIDAQHLIAASADVDISGAGNVKLHATRHPDVKISGSGSVQYAGSPTDVTQKITGSGSVSKLP